MQILSTINSIIRLKFTRQINLHFHTWTDIFQHTYPYRIIDNIFMQFFSTTFLPPGRCFLKTIKCILYSLLLIENYSQLIIYNLRQSSQRFDMHIVYMAIFPRKMSKLVWNCQSTLRFVEACKSYFFPSLSLYPYIWKLFKESFDKFMQNSP